MALKKKVSALPALGLTTLRTLTSLSELSFHSLKWPFKKWKDRSFCLWLFRKYYLLGPARPHLTLLVLAGVWSSSKVPRKLGKVHNLTPPSGVLGSSSLSLGTASVPAACCFVTGFPLVKLCAFPVCVWSLGRLGLRTTSLLGRQEAVSFIPTIWRIGCFCLCFFGVGGSWENTFSFC